MMCKGELFMFFEIDMSNTNITMIWTHVFKVYVISSGCKSRHLKKPMFRKKLDYVFEIPYTFTTLALIKLFVEIVI